MFYKNVMKKLILLTISVILAISAGAETKRETRNEQFKEDFPYKYEVTLGWAGCPLFDALIWGHGMSCEACREMALMDEMGHLNYLYRTVNGGEYMTGLISGEFNIHFKRWFTLSLEAGVNGIWGKHYNRLDGCVVEKSNGATVTLLPQAQFNWLNRKNVRLYSSVGLGLTAGRYNKEFGAYPSFQLSPFGITAGNKVFFYAEHSVGTTYLGGKFGVGYRF